jgi:ABC-type dipeptide/oligopeptide/nickel transport system ATPase component
VVQTNGIKKELDLEIPAIKSPAIVGVSGSGKTMTSYY